MNNSISDHIDISYKIFCELVDRINTDIGSKYSEEDIRLKIIDPIFTTVLNWNIKDISTEEHTGAGFVDYKFSLHNSARLIVEAKKDSISLGLNHCTPGKAYKLDGPILSVKPQPREGILQAINYCGAKNAELACVTNGNEWIIFRGSRLGDGHDTLSGKAFVFPNIQSIKENFKLFFHLLTPINIQNLIYRGYFQDVEGQPIRAKSFSKTIRAVNGFRMIERSEFSVDLDRIMGAFFRRLSGDSDDEMLSKCFVATKESQIADERIARITDELAIKIKTLDTTNTNALIQVIQRVKDTQRNEFILLVGTKGAGKSTFTDRFFRFILSKDILDTCVVLRINVGNSTGNPETIIDWLNTNLLSEIENKIFEKYGPSYDELQGIYFDEYMRWMKGPYKYLYESNKPEFKIKFGEYIENMRKNKIEDYIKRLLTNVVSSRKKTPCLVFDNTDHFSIKVQEMVFQYARSIYETTLCLIIIPITDKTSWQLSNQGALQSFESESFFLPTPTPKIVIGKRITFLEEKLCKEKSEKGRDYFLKKGIRLKLDDLQAFVVCLQQIFLNSDSVSKWIGQLANHDIRRCLQMVRNTISSPYIKVDQLVKAYITNSAITVPEYDIIRAIIRKGYNYYPTGQNEFVQNIFALSTEVETTPLISLRVLRMLRDAKHHDSSGFEDYVTIEQMLDYFQAIGIERRATLLSIDALLKSGLCFSYDPTITDINSVQKVQLSPSGLQHLHWGTWNEVYIGSMLQITPISDEMIHENLLLIADISSHGNWKRSVILFLEYLLREDKLYSKIIDHESYLGQVKLINALRKKIDKLGVNCSDLKT